MTTPNPGSLTKREKALLAHIRKTQPVSVADLVLAFKMNPKTMSVHLQNLRGKGVISNDGAGRYARWSAVPPPPKAPPEPKPAGVAIEQVSSVWHWAARHARAA